MLAPISCTARNAFVLFTLACSACLSGCGSPEGPAPSAISEVRTALDGSSVRLTANAVTVDSAERDPLFEKAKKEMPQFAGYEKAPNRVLPVVRLDS